LRLPEVEVISACESPSTSLEFPGRSGCATRRASGTAVGDAVAAAAAGCGLDGTGLVRGAASGVLASTSANSALRRIMTALCANENNESNVFSNGNSGLPFVEGS
jgi:hypothetical protein